MHHCTLLPAALLVLAAGLPAAAQDAPLSVVATFSVLGDMTERVGGDHVEVTTIVGPGGDPHVYQPTPADARALSDADVLVENGLNFEGWMSRLTEAATFDGIRATATDGIDAIAYDEAADAPETAHDHADAHGHAEEHGHGHGHDEDHAGDHPDEHAHDADHDHDHDHAAHDHADDHAGHDHAAHDHGAYDPHAWQSPDAARIYVGNIADALIEAAPDHADAFRANRDAYLTEIDALDTEMRDLFAAIPEDRRTIVTSHDAFGYLGREFDLTFRSPQGLSTESEASARDVAGLIEQIRDQGISAVFVENIADPRLLERIASETGATIGGTLYPGTLSGPDGPAVTYLDMMRHNARTIARAGES